MVTQVARARWFNIRLPCLRPKDRCDHHALTKFGQCMNPGLTRDRGSWLRGLPTAPPCRSEHASVVAVELPPAEPLVAVPVAVARVAVAIAIAIAIGLVLAVPAIAVPVSIGLRRSQRRHA